MTKIGLGTIKTRLEASQTINTIHGEGQERKIHCRACDKLLSEYQSTLKNAVTGEYFDLCKHCFEDIKPFVKVLDRKDLISEADLDEDDLEDFDSDLSTGASLEDYDDLISNYRVDSDEL